MLRIFFLATSFINSKPYFRLKDSYLVNPYLYFLLCHLLKNILKIVILYSDLIKLPMNAKNSKKFINAKKIIDNTLGNRKNISEFADGTNKYNINIIRKV